MGNSTTVAKCNSRFVLNRIKSVTNDINWLLSLSCIPTDDGSIQHSITVSFDYIFCLILLNKLSYDVNCHNHIVAVYDSALISHHKLSIQTEVAG